MPSRRAGDAEARETDVGFPARQHRVPPQGIYFEALVEKALKTIKKPFTPIEATSRNQPSHDLFILMLRALLEEADHPLPALGDPGRDP